MDPHAITTARLRVRQLRDLADHVQAQKGRAAILKIADDIAREVDTLAGLARSGMEQD